MKIRTNPLLGTWELAESDSARPSAARIRTDRIPCTRNSLLIVDDEAMVRRAFQIILSRDLPGLSIELATNGAEAVEQFRVGHHAVILMDLSMPVMDGEKAFFEIERICHADKWAMPAIVFCTGHSPSSNLRDIVLSDHQHCMLQKPVRNKLLVEIVTARLQR